jgi:flagellar protein FliS
MSEFHNAYLETQVTTATPQKLRLMLIEGAIRFAQQTIDCWADGRGEDALSALLRCQSIIAELLGGVREDGTALTRQVIGIYTFLALRLHEAELDSDRLKLEEVIRVLQEERQTWQEVCQHLAEAPRPADIGVNDSGEILAPSRVDTSFTAGYAAPGMYPQSSSLSSGSFSLEM